MTHLNQLKHFRGDNNVSRTHPLALNGLEEAEDRLAVFGFGREEGGWPPKSCLPRQSYVGSGDHVGNEEFLSFSNRRCLTKRGF